MTKLLFYLYVLFLTIIFSHMNPFNGLRSHTKIQSYLNFILEKYMIELISFMYKVMERLEMPNSFINILDYCFMMQASRSILIMR